MLIFTTKTELQSHLTVLKNQGKTLGFVPTMGALHEGHLSLIKLSRSTCDLSICSIFVNPTQFNDKADLDRYPRMPEKDAEMLRSAQCDILFMPSVDEMYGSDKSFKIDLGALNTVLEAAHRPGHFDGVAQIVGLFFEIIQPNKAFFGSKDYQQVLVVKSLNRIRHFNIDIVACPIVREADGLAMSSRNALLSAEEREEAAKIPIIMREAADLIKTESVQFVYQFVAKQVAHIRNCKLDYFELADPDTLQAIPNWAPGQAGIILIALFIGKIRLIDNLIIK
jgi:pantoate--beta-alanine ligase